MEPACAVDQVCCQPYFHSVCTVPLFTRLFAHPIFKSVFFFCFCHTTDWSEGSKDGFPGNIGTVIRQDDNGYIKCIFDGESAEVPSLRMGVSYILGHKYLLMVL